MSEPTLSFRNLRRNWRETRDQVKDQLNDVRAFRALSAGELNGRVQIKRLGQLSADSEEYARLAGVELPADAEVLVLMTGGKPVILGLLQRAAAAALTFALPIVGKQGFNSPAYTRYSQNSADNASNSSTGTWLINFDWTWTLPDGTWSVAAETDQMISQGTSGQVARARTKINSTAGTELTAAVPADPIRSLLPSEVFVTGLAGTITIAGEFRPNAAATTTYAGGGRGRAIAFRTA